MTEPLFDALPLLAEGQKKCLLDASDSLVESNKQTIVEETFIKKRFYLKINPFVCRKFIRNKQTKKY